MDENKYYLVINGKPEGPFSLDELKQKSIKPDDFVKTASMPDYKEAHEVEALRGLLGSKKPLVTPQYFAGFDQRLLASAIDWLIVSGVLIVLALIVVLFVSEQTVRIGIALSLLVWIPLVKIVYHITMESSPKQATYGKQIVKIKVCDLEGERLSVRHSAGRNLAKIFSVLTLFLGYLYSFFNKRQQCLHDVIAGTLVMKDRLL